MDPTKIAEITGRSHIKTQNFLHAKRGNSTVLCQRQHKAAAVADLLNVAAVLPPQQPLHMKLLGKIRFMPPQLREIGFHVQNHATQWHGFQHEIQFQEVVVAWIQLTHSSIYDLSSRFQPLLCFVLQPNSHMSSHTPFFIIDIM